MLRNAARFLLPLGIAVVAACSDLAPPSISVSLDRTGRHYSVRDDSLVARADSVYVRLAGAGADTARWTASRSGAGALVLLDSAGTASGWLRWTRDGTLLPSGQHLDTIRVVVPGAGGSPASLVESLTVRPYPTRFMTVRRAWRPGERDSVIARIVAVRGLALPYVGDVSDNAGSMLAADSVTEIVPNPAFSPSAGSGSGSGPARGAFALVPNASWQILGIKIVTVNNSQGGATLQWLGYVFFNGADPTWKGIMIGASGAAALNRIVDTPSFDASFGTAGAGGGEVQASTLTYWEARGAGSPNRLRVTASNFSGPLTTVTTGPFLGGTQQSGTMGGSLQQIVMTRVLGSAGDAADTADVTVSGITATYYECVFPTPCTTNAARGAEPPPWLGSRPSGSASRD